MKTEKNFWPLGIIVTFALFFIGMASVVVIAATHREHLVNNNYYEQELKYQSQIDTVARTQTSGAQLAFDAATGAVVIHLPGAQRAQKFSGAIELYRPAAPDLDQKFPLTPDAAGTQTLDVSKLTPGLWLVRVQWNAAGADYFLEQKITVTAK